MDKRKEIKGPNYIFDAREYDAATLPWIRSNQNREN